MSSPSDRAGLRAELKQLGVEMVTAEYDGEGDSGQVGDPDFGTVQAAPALVAASRTFSTTFSRSTTPDGRSMRGHSGISSGT